MNRREPQSHCYIQGNSCVRVASIQHALFACDYYLDCAHAVLYYVNSNHGHVFFAQPVDFPDSYDTDRKRTRYVVTQPGLARNQYQSQHSYLIYAADSSRYFLTASCNAVEHFVYTCDSYSLVDTVDTGYHAHDTLQSVFDRSRIACRILHNSIPAQRQDFPTL